MNTEQPPPGYPVAGYVWEQKSEAERLAIWRLSPLPSTEPPALKSPENQIDLATVYAMDANSLGLALVVGGKTVTYLISRTSAASLAGRIVEKLA